MGRIKSALEIAMEKTENIAIDENKIRINQENERIRRIAGEYLAKEERDDGLLKGLEYYDFRHYGSCKRNQEPFGSFRRVVLCRNGRLRWWNDSRCPDRKYPCCGI